uniref:Mediator complex subunit 15 KIX domain-containing protein n=1 Tax=Heterosigma akashiwo TaxID=2829 RepID=A0A7S3XLM6_HETAK
MVLAGKVSALNTDWRSGVSESSREEKVKEIARFLEDLHLESNTSLGLLAKGAEEAVWRSAPSHLEYTRLVCSKLSQAKALCKKSAPPLSSKELLDSLQDLLQGGRGPFETEVRKQAAASTIREASDPSPGAKPPSGAKKSACAGAATAIKEEAQCSPVLKVKEVEVKASMPAVVIKGAASRPAAMAQRVEPAPGPTATVIVKREPAPAAPAPASPAQAAAAAAAG